MTLTQKTIRRDISSAGIGLHSGERVEMRLVPAAANSGIRFRRVDLGGEEIPVAREYLDQTSYATRLRNGSTVVSTVEHVLAAASGLGIDNLIIELNGEEVPIMDGSAGPFVYLMHEAGVRRQQAPRRYIKITEPLRVEEPNKFMAIYPAERLKISYTIDFDHPMIGVQRETYVVTQSAFTRELAPARTFGFLREVEYMRSQGLALGGSIDNAIVVGDNSILNPQLRFPTSSCATRSSMRSAISLCSARLCSATSWAIEQGTGCTPPSSRRSCRNRRPGALSPGTTSSTRWRFSGPRRLSLPPERPPRTKGSAHAVSLGRSRPSS